MTPHRGVATTRAEEARIDIVNNRSHRSSIDPLPPPQQRVLAAVILAAALYVLFLVVSGTQGKRGLRRDGGGAVTSRG